MVDNQNQKYEGIFGKSDYTEQNTVEWSTKPVTLMYHNTPHITVQFNNSSSENEDASSNNATHSPQPKC